MKSLALEHLPVIASAPGGVKKLRDLILQLAVMGKLVPQDPNDEPASKLLKLILHERKSAPRNAKRAHVNSSTPAIGRDSSSTLPIGWELVVFDDLVQSIASGGTPSKNNPRYWNGDIYWASVKDLGKSKYLIETQDRITKEGLENGSKLAARGSLIICTRMGLGKIAIAGVDVAINQDLKAIELTKHLDIDYFINFYRTLNVVGTGMTVAGIRQEELLSIQVPLPPLAEQHRIVAKVDELMALCDKLEGQQNDSEAAHSLLVKTLLDTLTQTQDADDFAACWARIKENFHSLFTTEESVDILKQTLLQLAVMGKLVPQDPNDEPASEWLRKVDKLRRELRAGKTAGPTDDVETPFALPPGWICMKLGDLGVTSTGGTPPRSKPEFFNGAIPFVKPGDIQSGVVQYCGERLTELGARQIGLITSPSVLMVCIGGSIGKVGYSTSACSMNQQLNSIEPYDKECTRLLFHFLRSPFFQASVVETSSSTTMPIISKGKWERLPFPVPPLAEQHRIVAKVDELMALCDNLKLDIQASRRLQEQVSSAMLQAAVSRDRDYSPDSNRHPVMSKA